MVDIDAKTGSKLVDNHEAMIEILTSITNSMQNASKSVGAMEEAMQVLVKNTQ